MAANIANIVSCLERRSAHTLLDLGCDDGVKTLRFAEAVGAVEAHGIEMNPERAALASGRGVHVVEADLNQPFPYDDGSFDVVVSNQVIEHLSDTDNFVAEAHRVLRPGGRVVASTENLASWHNIGALVFGWQPLSLTNISRAGPVGNPMALHRDEVPGGRELQHLRVFSYRGLTELFAAHGFRDVDVLGAGLYPLPALWGRRWPRHAAFLTLQATRP